MNDDNGDGKKDEITASKVAVNGCAVSFAIIMFLAVCMAGLYVAVWCFTEICEMVRG
jgi:hypothetical protein